MSLSDAMRYLNTCVTISNHPPLPLKISKYTSMMLGSIWTPTFSIYTSQYFRSVLAKVSLLDYCYLFIFDIIIIIMIIWFGDTFSPHKMWYKLKGARISYYDLFHLHTLKIFQRTRAQIPGLTVSSSRIELMGIGDLTPFLPLVTLRVPTPPGDCPYTIC